MATPIIQIAKQRITRQKKLPNTTIDLHTAQALNKNGKLNFNANQRQTIIIVTRKLHGQRPISRILQQNGNNARAKLENQTAIVPYGNASQPQTQGKIINTMTSKKQDTLNLLRLMTGLPKHGTRWARAQNPTPERA
jgi:hypothetical protein